MKISGYGWNKVQEKCTVNLKVSWVISYIVVQRELILWECELKQRLKASRKAVVDAG